MPISNAAWRASLVPASFAGNTFHIDAGSQAGGRRGPLHEFPNRDVPFAEDLGRRARRWTITGYVIVSPTNSNYIPARNALIAACEAAGTATLVHPTLGSMQVKCDTYAVSETRERGGIATFQMVFVEAGSQTGLNVTSNTGALAIAAANAAGQAAAQGLDRAMQSSIANTSLTKINNNAGVTSSGSNIG